MMKGNLATEELKSLLETLLPFPYNYKPVVQEQQQNKILNALAETVNDEVFYFVFSLQNFTLENVQGVEKWLGYSNREFTVNKYLNCVVPDQSVQFNMIAQSMYKLLCKGIFRLQFHTQRYMSNVALKHANGEYISFKKTTSVFQYDEQNRLLAQLNVFNKIGPYEGGSLGPRVTEMGELQKDAFEKKVFKMTLESLMEKKIFSPKEFEVLQQYAQHKNIPGNTLAELLDVKPYTIYTFNKRILNKARETFTRDFDSAKDVAEYLKKERILS